MSERDDELMLRLALMKRLTVAARAAATSSSGDPWGDEMAKLTEAERTILAKMKAESARDEKQQPSWAAP